MSNPRYQALTEELNEHRRKLVGSVVRHVNSGGVYEVDDIVFREADMKPMVIYFPHVDDEEITMNSFARPLDEFMDGRFAFVGKLSDE